jgi:hypothetical protein
LKYFFSINPPWPCFIWVERLKEFAAMEQATCKETLNPNHIALYKNSNFQNLKWNHWNSIKALLFTWWKLLVKFQTRFHQTKIFTIQIPRWFSSF